MTQILMNNRRSTPTLKPEVVPYNPDKSFRVVYAPQGRPSVGLMFDDARNFARVLREKAGLARAQQRHAEAKAQRRWVATLPSGTQLVTVPPPPPIAITRGQVRAQYGRVHVGVDLHKPAVYEPDDAEELARKLVEASEIAKAKVWQDVESYQTDPVNIKEFLGMPIVRSYQEYERLGDHTC